MKYLQHRIINISLVSGWFGLMQHGACSGATQESSQPGAEPENLLARNAESAGTPKGAFLPKEVLRARFSTHYVRMLDE